MKKHLFALSLSLCMAFGLGSTAFGQVTEKNGTPQAPAYDFEFWDDPEPWGWNSSSCFEAGNVPSSQVRNLSVWSSNDTRPGSKGQYSARLQVTLSKWKDLSHWFSYISALMGSLTTGVPYYANENLQNEKSCLYTNTGDGSKSWAFTGRPDSVVFWVKKGVNGGRPADFTMYLHDNAKLEDRNPNGTASGTVIGSASCKITNTDWQRISLPIEYVSDATPAYLLASFTAGNNFREVVEGDELYVDDMMFIYKPSLHIDLEDVVPVPVHRTEPFASFEVPFTLNGTMSPFNLEEDNVIYVELSDENGAFDAPRTLNSLTTDESGKMVCQFPLDLPFSADSHYKIRLRATNYPLLSDNTVELAPYYVYRLNITEPAPVWAAEINTVDTLLPENAVYTALCDNIMTGLHLSQWLLNGEAVSNALSYTLTMDQDYTLTAQFDTNYYAVTVLATVGGVFELDGADGTQTRYEAEIIHNAVLNLNAAADFGYHFREWQLNGETLSTDNPLAYTVTDVSDLTAVFDTNVYEISFSAIPADMGSASNSGAYKHFTAAASTAEPAAYAQFSHWRKAGETEAVSYEATLTIGSVSAEAAYEAVFSSQTFDVTTAAEPAEGGQTAGDATYEAFPLTQQAQVSAQANEGYHFTYWTYAIDGANQTDRPTDNPLVFVENGHVAHAYAFTAHFDINRYALTAEAEHGMVEGDGTFEHGAEVTLSATPDYGYAFNGWYENGDLLGDEPTLTLTLTAERHLTAVCTPLTYTLTFGVNDPTLGHITQPDEAEGVYEHFTELTVTAEATEGNEFRHWLVNGEQVDGAATHTLTVEGPMTVEAFFTPLRKQLTVLNPQEERGTVAGEGLYEHGAAAELTANAAFGYQFTHWTDEAGETYTANPFLSDALTENRTLTVHFETMPFDLCISNPTPKLGTYTVNDETPAESCLTFPYLHTVTLTATPAAKKRFVGWRDAETDELLSDNPLQLTVRANMTLTAEFDDAVYAVQGAAYPTEAAYITGSDDYYLNATAKLEAIPHFGFTFTGWYDEQGERLGEDLLYTFPVKKAAYYVARFDRNNYTLTVAATEGGTAVGGGERPYGYNTKVEAQPAEGWQFNGWYDAQGALVSDQAVYYPTVLNDETLTAQFGPKALNLVLSCEPAEAGEIKRLGQADAGFFYNQTVKFQAQPEDVYTFSHWSDANGNRLGEDAELTRTLTTDLHLTAHFSVRAFQTANISVQPANAGQLVNLPETWVYGQSYTAEVNRTDERYTFIGWIDAEGKTRSTDMAYTFTFDNRPLVAQFEAKAVAVNIACEPAQAGHVTLTGEPRYFETVTLHPQAARGYRFAAWRNTRGETLEATAELTWNLDGDLNLTALFEPETYAIVVTAVPEAGGLIAGPATAAYGSTVTMTATANDGYEFQAYEDAEGKAVGYEATLTATVNGPLNLHARFTPRSYTLRAVPADKTLGQTKGSGLFAFGETVTVKAWPMAAGYTFSHWSADPEGNDRLSEEAEYQYTMTAENRTIYACFKLQTLQLELTANLPQAGTLQGGGEKTYGET
ncbi:MAG: InlB B-repeat-containing protein, partial [Bacteroidales bacterium]|nr:InlB B-repeat-containing protein [Bacteroidales bacterium]